VWKYLIATAALVALAQGDLRHISADTVPLGSLPNIVYSALTAVGGYVITHYALVRIGATRTSSYFNFNPIVAATAGILILGEPLSLVLLVGGALTIYGVVIVRRNIFLRPPRPASG
jgi:drug/metabolite transporter (DMT)-like permease